MITTYNYDDIIIDGAKHPKSILYNDKPVYKLQYNGKDLIHKYNAYNIVGKLYYEWKFEYSNNKLYFEILTPTKNPLISMTKNSDVTNNDFYICKLNSISSKSFNINYVVNNTTKNEIKVPDVIWKDTPIELLTINNNDTIEVNIPEIQVIYSYTFELTNKVNIPYDIECKLDTQNYTFNKSFTSKVQSKKDNVSIVYPYEQLY